MKQSGKSEERKEKKMIWKCFLQLAINSVGTSKLVHEISSEVWEHEAFIHELLSPVVKDCPMRDNSLYFQCVLMILSKALRRKYTYT